MNGTKLQQIVTNVRREGREGKGGGDVTCWAILFFVFEKIRDEW